MRRLEDRLGRLWKDTWELNRQTVISLFNADIDTILDCGCDVGEFTKRVAQSEMVRRAVGIGINKNHADKAAERGIEVIIGDLTDNLLSEIWRVLKPGGVLVVSTENLASWHNIFALLLGWQPFSLTNISEHGAGIGNPLSSHRREKGIPKPSHST